MVFGLVGNTVRMYLREYIKQGNKIVTSQRGCWAREFVLEEYDWAVAKTLFRSECDFSHATLSRRVDRALDALALEVVWLSARRARDYMRAYVALAGENEGVATALQKQEIEEQKVEQKKHRDALDFSLKWVQSLLHHPCTLHAPGGRKAGLVTNTRKCL